MPPVADEGYTEDDDLVVNGHEALGIESVQEREELAYQLLASLPRSRLAAIQRKITPLLQFDVVGSLPAEVSLQIFSHLPSQTLLTCSLVSHRWQTLANDQNLWKILCLTRNWEWHQPSRIHPFNSPQIDHTDSWDDSDDEGMGDSDEDDNSQVFINNVEAARAELTLMHAELDSGFASTSFTSAGPPVLDPSPGSSNAARYNIFPSRATDVGVRGRAFARHSAPSVLKTMGPTSFLKPDYKLLHQTRTRLHNRFLSSSYRLSALQTRGAPPNAHTNTIYCLQLYTYPSGLQVLFTGSRDKTVREWNLTTGMVERVISDAHSSSVLSICVHNGFVASAGSDRRVAVWDLEANKLVKVICDHEDSVLCVRFDNERLVSCSKDRTVRTYSFPDLTPQFVLGAHRAAVNAVSLSRTLIVSGSGDRSIRLWDAVTGKLLRTFENHHSRGIASIDFQPPLILSGSSDKHLRLVDMTTLQGWSTSPEYQYDNNPPSNVDHLPFPFVSTGLSGNANGRFLCQICGSDNVHPAPSRLDATEVPCTHGDLVRSVALGEDFVVSGSYDLSIKVWDRRTGSVVADLTGGHTARIFCIGFDCTKIVSCGEDQRICIWDFSHGIDTSFLQLSP